MFELRPKLIVKHKNAQDVERLHGLVHGRGDFRPLDDNETETREVVSGSCRKQHE